MVPRAGIEPARPQSRGILSPLCLPISPSGQIEYFIITLLKVEARAGIEPASKALQASA